ncbi:hypothetical protein GCM10009574_044570 [Streptomyces asiaticus]|uniref:Uncharacterized protein n=2 Tax=Streptomyces rhizosphaericus TaxID=114699 RepID=A0ABP3ZBX7_9ACTN
MVGRLLQAQCPGGNREPDGLLALKGKGHEADSPTGRQRLGYVFLGIDQMVCDGFNSEKRTVRPGKE